MQNQLWPDGRKAAFLLAFDDNAPTHLDFVIPELEKRGLIGTFYINPGTEHFQQQRERWQAAAQSPHIKLANHTFTHRGASSVAELERELEPCNAALYALNPELVTPRYFAFGIPGGVPWTISDDELSQTLTKYHLICRPAFSIPHYPEKTPEQIAVELIAAVDEALERGGMAHLVFHGVGGDWLSTPKESFLSLLDKLEAHRDELWICDPVSLQQHCSSQRTASIAFPLNAQSTIH